MAKTVITVRSSSRTALLDLTTPAWDQINVVDGMEFTNTGREIIIAMNTTATAYTITVVGQTACDAGVVHSTVTANITNAMTGGIILGPFDTYHYNDALNKVQLTITGTAAAGATLAVVKLAS